MFQPRDIPMVELFTRNPFHKKNKKPDPITMTLHITLEQSYNGCSIPLEIIRWAVIGDEKIQEEETVYVDIYEGIDNNNTMALDTDSYFDILKSFNVDSPTKNDIHGDHYTKKNVYSDDVDTGCDCGLVHVLQTSHVATMSSTSCITDGG